MSAPLVSICIPTYEQNGAGAKHLIKLLDTCFDQDIHLDQDMVEIIISDNSVDDTIQDIAFSSEYLYGKKLPIHYVRNEKRGVAVNTNNAIDQAQGDIIKIMYMDDYFLENNALMYFVNILTNIDPVWCISDSHWVDAEGNFIKEFNGHYSDKLTNGLNTIGMPSVVAFRKTDIRFDPNLKTSLDSFFYYQLFKKYGPPAKITRPLIAQRIHKDSISKNQPNHTQSDLMYMRKKIAQEDPTKKRSFPFGGGGTGAKSYASLCATASDINEHLPVLKEIAMQCDHVVEFGVRDVVSTYALIEGTPKTICSYDIKATLQITPATKHAKEMGVDLKYLVIDVLKLNPVETDFLFIDTLHNYEQLSQELTRHASGVRKFIGFHDVTTFGLKDEQGEGKTKTGLLPAIIEFMQLHPEWQIYRYHHFNNGLLILKKNEKPGISL